MAKESDLMKSFWPAQQHDYFVGFPEDPPLALNEEDEKELDAIKVEIGKFAKKIGAAQRKRIELFRNCAREQGLIAHKLQNLCSEDGKFFVEMQAVGSLRWARAGEEQDLNAEMAYLCRDEFQLSEKRCGWVKGKPCAQSFNNMGEVPLSGSAGTNYFCRICRLPVGTITTARSFF